jgi:hypothetical protein
MAWGSCHFLINSESFNVLHEPPWYGTVCPVVWEDGGREPPSYPVHPQIHWCPGERN